MEARNDAMGLMGVLSLAVIGFVETLKNFSSSCTYDDHDVLQERELVLLEGEVPLDSAGKICLPPYN